MVIMNMPNIPKEYEVEITRESLLEKKKEILEDKNQDREILLNKWNRKFNESLRLNSGLEVGKWFTCGWNDDRLASTNLSKRDYNLVRQEFISQMVFAGWDAKISRFFGCIIVQRPKGGY